MIKTWLKHKICDYSLSLVFDKIALNLSNNNSKKIRRVTYKRYLTSYDYENHIPYSTITIQIGMQPLEVNKHNIQIHKCIYLISKIRIIGLNTDTAKVIAFTPERIKNKLDLVVYDHIYVRDLVVEYF